MEQTMDWEQQQMERGEAQRADVVDSRKQLRGAKAEDMVDENRARPEHDQRPDCHQSHTSTRPLSTGALLDETDRRRHDYDPSCSRSFLRTRRPSSASCSGFFSRSEEHTSELQSQSNLVCRL